jgi:hypothetical protein
MGDEVEGGGATLLMWSRKEDAFTDRPPLLVISNSLFDGPSTERA